MTSLKTSSHSLSNSPQTAEVRVVFPLQWPWSNYISAYVFVLSRIYWKPANEDVASAPLSLKDFRGATSLELIRLKQETWNEVDEIIKVDKYEGRTRITVRGRLHGRNRRNNLFSARNVEIEIIPNTSVQQEV